MDEESLFKLLVCPACRGEVHREGERVVCASCGMRYPIREGIPILLVHDARKPPESQRLKGS
ncbi:MAG: Trm112 family protein [Planctomycetia bacterium]|nr:Trm112 family protein [Planctomycetia bacterium]